MKKKSSKELKKPKLIWCPPGTREAAQKLIDMEWKELQEQVDVNKEIMSLVSGDLIQGKDPVPVVPSQISVEEFTSGAVRDGREGKGRYDLISSAALHELAVVCETGAKHYTARNYEKGMNLSRFIDSAVRHIYQLLEGHTNENHAAHAMWNIMAFIHTRKMIERGLLPKELNDLPKHL